MSFDKTIQGTGDWMRGLINKERRALVNEFLGEVLVDPRANAGVGTPRDTGRAAGGWQASAGAPSGFNPQDVRVVNAADEVAKLPEDNNLKTDYYVTNNVEYIGVLAEGHSQQAPGRFVEEALDKLERRSAG